MAKVYVKTDSNDVITEINSNIFLKSVENYIMIDEGEGDRYAHAQGNYLDKGLIDDYGRYNYKQLDGKAIELTEVEKKALFPPIEQELSEQERFNAAVLLELAKLKAGDTA
jgi:hypothetical protein